MLQTDHSPLYADRSQLQKGRSPFHPDRPLLRLKGGVVRHPDFRLAEPVDLELRSGEAVAVYGANGAGKSLLVAMLTGAQPLLHGTLRYAWSDEAGARTADLVRHITFRDAYAGHAPAYYQQRWNCADEQVFPTVGELLEQARGVQRIGEGASRAAVPNDTNQTTAAQIAEAADTDLLAATRIGELLSKPVNQLSSGELRRFQIARALLSFPRLLVIDNPFIGLDAATTAAFSDLLSRLARRLTLVLVTSRADEIPAFVRHVVTVRDRRVVADGPRPVEKNAGEMSPLPALPLPLPVSHQAADTPADAPLIRFRGITIRYGERTILRNLDWTVHRGQHWALTGQNGAGKSTLLSLVCADNPQAYACDITLFGRRRGRGESIWDIKRRIGYVAPELFSTYRKSLPVLDIVASGLRDTIGLYHRPTDAERAHSLAWMQAFEAAHLAERDYLRLSFGEQRLVLLVRAFVKNPDLLILDEPFHGLDAARRRHARSLIDRYMRRPDKTLIMVTHLPDELPDCIDHRLELRKQS